MTATAGPAIASLTGDYFPASERGRVYAYILGGEIAGTAVGFIISGSVASLIDWRAAFLLLAIPGFFLARELVAHRARAAARRAELARAGGRWTSSRPVAAGRRSPSRPTTGRRPSEPRRRARTSPTRRRAGSASNRTRTSSSGGSAHDGLVAAVRYILQIPTNMLMIISSSLGYFYFSGLSTFALLFVRGHYHAGQATAELVLGMLVLGALVGTLVSGRVTDMLLRRGHLEARIWIPAFSYIAAAVLLIPGLLLTISPPPCGSTSPAPLSCRRRIPRSTRRGSTSCPPASGGVRRARARCSGRSPRRWRRSCSAGSPT